jgi:protease AXL1
MASIRTFNERLAVPYTSSSRSHKLIVLPNGILTLLVSDPTEDLASAALCVASGAHNDPEEIPGLAHFCEHLLFLGSKQFPHTSEFHDLLSKSGGRRNAFTTGEQTCFFFEVPSDALHKEKDEELPLFNHLIKMFADCVKAPLFPESMFEKEVYAIDNEHTANVNKSGRVMYHGLRLISNRSHPFHRFATGNFFTLNDIPKIKKRNVRDQMRRYYSENYVADRMTLVVRGSQSLNLLQKLAVSNFGDIKTVFERSEKREKMKLFSSRLSSQKSDFDDKKLDDFDVLSTWNYDCPVFSESELLNCILINTTKTPILRMVFPVDANSRHANLFEIAWCNILGDEGSGSLLDILNSVGYAVAVSAFSQNLCRGDDVLVLEVRLTNTGSKGVCEVIGIIMDTYKKQIFSEQSELARYLFEMESIDLLTYLHKDISKSPMEEASTYAQNLQKQFSSLGTRNIIKGSTNWNSGCELGTAEGDEFWGQKSLYFKKFTDSFFNINNMKFILMADSKINSALSDKLNVYDSGTDQFFNFEYTKAKFDPSSFQGQAANFSFVERNRFIPKFALDHKFLQKMLDESSVKASNSSLAYSTKSSWTTTKAQLITSNRQFELWTKPESLEIFKSKVYISFDLISCSLRPSPLNTMQCEVLVELIKLKVANMLYSSELLNYTWEIHASLKGDVRFGFTLSGFSDGVEHLLKILVEGFKNVVHSYSFTRDDFRRARVAVRARYKDVEQDSSLAMALTGLLVVLEENIWNMEERLDVLDDIDSSSFKTFLGDFKTGSKFLKMIVHGDTRLTERFSATVNQISNHLNENMVSTHSEPSTVLIKPRDSYCITREGPKSDPTNSVCFFIQTGARSDPSTVYLTKLFAFLMSLFIVPDLRFKKQLGYVVLGGTRILRTTVGLHITIMSATFSPQYLEKKIDEYLLSWEQQLSKMDQPTFQSDVVNAYLKTMDKNLHQSGGPESLTSEMLPSVGSSNCTGMGDSMKLHRKIRDAIFNNDYDPEFDAIGVKVLERLTKAQMMDFFSQRITPSSSKRSRLSVRIQCPLSPEETRQQLMCLQLEAFLKINGLRISSDKLKDIVDKSGGSPVYLLKDLFKFFVGQGESLRLCSVVLKEVVNQVSQSFKHKSERNISSETIKGNLEVIEDISEFQRKNSILRVGGAF